MIPGLASPAVCVIDDDPEDYEPILSALIGMGLGCVHVRGRGGDALPPEPFGALRLVFTDLHLSGQVGKDAASHTANVVRKVVSAECGPVLIVIWSKYGKDPAGDVDLPPEDQPTEAALFKAELLNAEPKFRSRVIFAEMSKPKLPDRPSIAAWVKMLQDESRKILQGIQGVDVLWIWEALARECGIEVSETVAKLADGGATEGESISRLMSVMRRLAQRQAGPDISPQTASRHLLSVLSQIGADLLEKKSTSNALDTHGQWLAATIQNADPQPRAAKLNGALLTSDTTPMFAMLVPGTVYDVIDPEAMAAETGFSLKTLQRDCYSGSDAGFVEFSASTTAVFIEISPACDFHQNSRRCALLVGGVVFPGAMEKKGNSKDACKRTPVFEDRFAAPPVDVGMVFCARYRLGQALVDLPGWLRPRLRFRENLLTDIRNWHASQAARVGFLSF